MSGVLGGTGLIDLSQDLEQPYRKPERAAGPPENPPSDIDPTDLRIFVDTLGGRGVCTITHVPSDTCARGDGFPSLLQNKVAAIKDLRQLLIDRGWLAPPAPKSRAKRRNFKVAGRFEGKKEASVSIVLGGEVPLVEVRPYRSRKCFTSTLQQVAQWVIFAATKVELKEKAKLKPKKARRRG